VSPDEIVKLPWVIQTAHEFALEITKDCLAINYEFIARFFLLGIRVGKTYSRKEAKHLLTSGPGEEIRLLNSFCNLVTDLEVRKQFRAKALLAFMEGNSLLA